jgi:hypothetical protein
MPSIKAILTTAAIVVATMLALKVTGLDARIGLK